MQIKKFTGNTLKDAIEIMKDELGDNAIVLSTKVIEGIHEEKRFEVTAGVEDEIETGNEYSFNQLIDDEEFIEEVTDKESKGEFAGELKKLTNKIYGNSNKSKSKVKKSLTKPKQGPANRKRKCEKVKQNLLEREIEEPIVDSIINQLNKYNTFVGDGSIDNYIISTIESMIPTDNFKLSKRGGPKTIALVGPTGVGKTTCIAKLAVISKILHNLDIGLITIDTYRLGALDQLKILAEISNIDFLVAYEPSDLPKLVSKFKKKNLIFIDTVGRSQKNKELLQNINTFLKAVKIDETFLVMSSTVTLKTMEDVAGKFKLFDYNGLIFTKMDEAIEYGNILNITNKVNVPIKYLTNGQVIPDDIIAADSEFLANVIYTGNFNQ
jgi:flagellar biosynthesis protein FlhF